MLPLGDRIVDIAADDDASIDHALDHHLVAFDATNQEREERAVDVLIEFGVVVGR
jgi:hypothetical protein